jgi:diguanylate cyclase (GGDEF)-like protein
MKPYRYTLLFLALLVTLLGFLEHYLDRNKKEEIHTLSTDAINLAKVSYQTIFNGYKLTAQRHFSKLLENHHALELLKQFKATKSEDKRSFIRGRLYRLLAKEYQTLELFGIRQFHFHTHQGESLLRFHKPYKSGDSLIDIRPSIAYANQQLQPFYGFEGGKVFPGFRFVFPIIYEKEHLGSVEFSIPFEAIEKQLQNVLPNIGYQLQLNRKASYDVVFENFKPFFKSSPLISEYYVEHPSISEVESRVNKNEIIQNLQPSLKPLLPQEALKKRDHFTVTTIYHQRGYQVNFISINRESLHHSAYLVSYNYFDELITIENKYRIYKILIYTVALTLLIFAWIIKNQFHTILTNHRYIQQLINTVDHIIILSNGKEINFANRKFLNFFGVKSIEAFKQKHLCICEHFIHDDAFFHLGKIDPSHNWLDKIQELPSSKRVVLLQDSHHQQHAFSIHLNKFDRDLSIITFTDISQTLSKYFQLEEQVLHDKLTGLFNREYFDQHYRHLLHHYSQGEGHFALSLLDLDHFKRVNDSYGHTVGDEILMHFANTLNHLCNQEDIRIRWGGEEFIILSKVTSLADLNRRLNTIQRGIKEEHFPHDIPITCSIGGTLYHPYESIESTIKRADEALYQAKSNGRDQVVVR